MAGISQKRWPILTSVFFYIVIIAFVCVLHFPSLGSYALRDWDESIYAQVARESSVFTFTWLGQGGVFPQNVWLEKPPLVIWLVQLSSSVFGAGEWSARFWTPLFGAGILLLCYLWAKDIAKSTVAGIAAAASLFFCYHFLLSLGTLNMDVPLSFFILLSLYAYARTKDREGYWLLFGFAVGLGVLTKSVLGLLPVPIVLLDLCVTRQLAVLRGKYFWRGVFICVVIVVPWHVVQVLRFGPMFWQSYIGHQVLARFFTPIENNGQPWWYYVKIFAPVPYGLMAVAGVVYGAVCAVRQHAQALLPFLTLVFMAVVLSAAKTKGDLYIVLVYPYFSLLIGLGVARLLSFISTPWLRHVVLAVFVLTACVSAVQFNEYRLVRMRGAVYEDVKEIGLKLKREHVATHVYYVPLETSADVISARPELIYYSTMPVGGAALTDVAGLTSVFRTRTHQLFVRGENVYVVAVRYIP